MEHLCNLFMGISFYDIKVKDRPVSNGQCLYGQYHLLITELIQDILLKGRRIREFVQSAVVMFNIFFMVVDRGIDQDPSEPEGKGFLLVILDDIRKNLHISVIQHFHCFVPVVGISQTNAHSITVKLLIEQFLAFPVAF